jgi:4-hydroxy-tetrahydrodipicolinate synthase
MDRRRFRGVGPAVITPMNADGSVDLEGFAEHVRFLIDGGVHFLVPCGTTGESVTLTVKEQAQLIEKCVELAAGRIPVMAGAGTNDTREAAERVRRAVEAGADGILSVSPYYNKPTQEGLYRHYMELADAAGVPLFVYTVPGRTAGNVLPETLFRLAEAHEMIAGVKEASGDMSQVMQILRDRQDDFIVLSGEDHLTFAMVALGGDGVISVVANEVPAPMSEMVDAALASDYPRARSIHYRLLELMQANFVETNPIPVKTALEMMGRHPAHFRLPLCEMADKNRERLQRALEAAGVGMALGDAAPAQAAAPKKAAGTVKRSMAARSAS